MKIFSNQSFKDGSMAWMFMCKFLIVFEPTVYYDAPLSTSHFTLNEN